MSSSTTNEEAIDLIVSCQRMFSDGPTASVVVVTDSRKESVNLICQLVEVFRECQMSLCNTTLQVENVKFVFVTAQEPSERIMAMLPVHWIPLSDNIPARTIREIIYRVQRGQVNYQRLCERGGIWVS